MGHCKSSPKGKVCSNTGTPQENKKKVITTKLVKRENRITEKYLKIQVKIRKGRSGKTEQVINTANHSNMVSSVQFNSVAQSCQTLRDPMNRSTPGLPVHHHLPEFTQTHVHRLGDAIQPSHPLSSPSPPALNPSQHQSLFQ